MRSSRQKNIVFLIVFFTLFVYAEKKLPIIDFAQTKKLIKQGAVLIDNRPEYKFRKGHIKGAVNLPFFMVNHPTNKMTQKNLFKALDNKKIIIFYCTGHKRAYHALKQAEKWGVKAKMYWYKNGFKDWKTR